MHDMHIINNIYRYIFYAFRVTKLIYILSVNQRFMLCFACAAAMLCPPTPRRRMPGGQIASKILYDDGHLMSMLDKFNRFVLWSGAAEENIRRPGGILLFYLNGSPDAIVTLSGVGPLPGIHFANRIRRNAFI